jgi:hypothetical protein
MFGVDWKTVAAVLVILLVLGLVAPQLRSKITG